MKPTSSKKLALRAVTLRPLTAGTLGAIRGGANVSEPTSYRCGPGGTGDGGDGGGGKHTIACPISVATCFSVDRCLDLSAIC